MKFISRVLLLFSILIAGFCQSQDLKDSLFHVLETTSSDTAKVDTYNELIWEYYGVNNDSALILARKSISLAEESGYKKGLSNAHRYAGLIYERLANYPRALFHQQQSLTISQELNNKPGIANSLNNIGIIYERLSDYKKALEYQQKSLELCIELDQKEGIAAVYGNLGNIYNSIQANEKSLDYYEKSLAIYEELGNPYGIAVSLGNIGNIYIARKEYDKALDYQLKSLKLREETGNIQGVAIAMHSVGDCYRMKGNYSKALYYYTHSLKFANETGALTTQRDANLGLYKVHKNSGNHQKALVFHEEYVRLNDSVFNSERNEEISTIKMQYALEKQQAELEQKSKEEKLKLQALAEAEKMRLKTESEARSKRQLIIIYFSVAGLILVILFSVFLYNRFAVTREQKNIIQTQKTIVEYKNKQITDSINYAKRIQSAILPSSEDFKKVFPESFILFLPKDIVSGDFYWINEISDSDIVIYATADCTGHGVPGGFMSMLGTSLLNEIVNENKIHDPGTILNILRDKIIHSLRQHEKDSESKDGMDIVVISLDKKAGKLSYAAANHHFYILTDDSIVELKGDKMPIGYQTGNDAPFSTKEYTLKKGDRILTFTDGFADQFGGPAGKKFKYSKLEELLLKNKTIPMNNFHQQMLHAFESWRGDLEQVDDICVIGVGFDSAPL